MVTVRPVTATASYLFGGDRWEAAVRYDDRDDPFDTTRVTVGLSHYMQGHDLKWVLALSSQSSDLASLDGSLIELGFVWRTP